MKRYSHPQHGFHVATGGEEEAMLKNGWTECGWEVKKKPPQELEELSARRETLRLKKG